MRVLFVGTQQKT